MTRDQKPATAGDCYKAGCNCAEAVVHGFRGQLPFTLSDDAMRVATCFGGGGIGESGFCGALSGAIMALGLFVGRSGPEGNREPAYSYAREFGTRFAAEFGANTCKALQVHVYASPEQKANCGRIVARTGDMLAAFLGEKDLLSRAR
jgi:C_GCAxxG_C_C family probable redox protein